MHRQPQSLSASSRIARAARALLLCALTCPIANADEPDLGAFASLQNVPDVVDAAAVFENPADAVLLSPVGRSMRTMLSFAGVFTHTEHAWQALADTFGAPKDDTIRSLLSKQVIVVWDGFESADPNTEGLTESIDTRWTLICKVEPEYLREIRKSLRPVKRDIVSNRPVYAIEQGRYRIALIDAIAPGEPASVLLAPRSGADLLHAVLTHYDATPTPPVSSVTQNREPMLAELNAQHAASADATWTCAFIARLEIFKLLSPDGAHDQPAQNHVLAGIIKLDQGQLRSTFGTDAPIEPDLPDAPIELYEAVANDSVLAVASAKSPVMFISHDQMSLSMGISTNPAQQQPDPALDAPFFMSLSGGDAQSMSLSVTLRHPKREPGETARMFDDAMHDIIASYDPDQAPRFDGCIPSAARHVQIQTQAQGEGSDTASYAWPGSNPQLAWSTSTAGEHDLTIASFAPDAIDAGEQVRSITLASHAIEAAGPRTSSGVLFRASILPEEAMRIIDDPSIADLAIAKLVRQLNIELRRGVHAPMRGSLRIQFSEHASKPRLGTDN